MERSVFTSWLVGQLVNCLNQSATVISYLRMRFQLPAQMPGGIPIRTVCKNKNLSYSCKSQQVHQKAPNKNDTSAAFQKARPLVSAMGSASVNRHVPSTRPQHFQPAPVMPGRYANGAGSYRYLLGGPAEVQRFAASLASLEGKPSLGKQM